MHYYALAVIPDDAEDVTDAVATLMAPYREGDEEGDTGFWDWYSIGGRYTGRISGYDPSTDPINYTPCRLCEGTGVRRDGIATGQGTHLIELVEPRFDKTHRRYGETGWCNGCNGTGMERNWSNAPHAGDVGVAGDVTDSPFTLVTSEGAWHREKWDSKDWVDTSAEMQEAWSKVPPTARVVVVDYHD